MVEKLTLLSKNVNSLSRVSTTMFIKSVVHSGDELCSDSFPMKLVDDLVYEFKGKHVVRKEGDIVLAGSNPSAEGEDGEDAGGDEHVERGIDFVLNHRLSVSY